MEAPVLRGGLTARWSGPGIRRKNQTRLYDGDAAGAQERIIPGCSARSRYAYNI